ncbi:MAG: YggS family pyridoxal phosphate-dependent enzyme [Bacteriovoracaceae bacterium]
MSDRKAFLSRKLSEVKAKLRPGVTLLIVSKTRPIEDIQMYYELGHRDFGENRVQELFEKSELLKKKCPQIRWHMIGHLQSNKINQLFTIENLHAIHSVHSEELLDKLMKAELRLSHPVEMYLQFNTSHEDEKSGFETYHELETAAENALKARTLQFVGLMTMGTLRTEDFEAEAGRCFQELQVEKQKLESELNVKLKTSMGMSQDYEIALREGTDCVRLGTMMFQ